jgi:hypothetical protein
MNVRDMVKAFELTYIDNLHYQKEKEKYILKNKESENKE